MVKARPKQDTTSTEEKQVTDLINKGGSVATHSEPTETIRLVQLRVPDPAISKIDGILATLRPKPSRHTWLLEAIYEKLERDL